MRKAIYWILVVVLVCSEGVFSACTKADGPDDAGRIASIKVEFVENLR